LGKDALFAGNGQVSELIDMALAEDVGTGDVTTSVVVPDGMRARGRIVARQDGVVAGLPVAGMVFSRLDTGITFEPLVPEGARVSDGVDVAHLSGPAAALLTGERAALNFLMRMSGIATATADFVSRLDGTGIRLLDTRKTSPGHRVLEKYAVTVGGGHNHRMNLAGGVLIKNNHIAVCGGVEAAIKAARAAAPATLKIEIEVRTRGEALQAIAARADMLLLDHMTPEMAAAVRAAAGDSVQLEVSGNMTPAKALEFAGAGIDYVSAGSITYGAGWMDFSMYLEMGEDEPTDCGKRV